MCVLVVACKKKANQDPDNNVPYTPINIVLYPNDPFYFKVQATGGWMYISGGTNGIIIYRKSSNEFVALERTSTYYPDNIHAIAKVQPDNFTCKDTISSSSWQIVDGAIITGPAAYPLKRYQTTYDGNALRIFN
jgi:hypothetical protein